MHHQVLCDAAIACSMILTAHNVPHAFFGGFAIIEACRGNGPAYRESKDIDCLVSGHKDDVVQMFEGREGWMVIPQGREDYVAFFWKNPVGGEMVLVELFVGTLPFSLYRIKAEAIANDINRTQELSHSPLNDPLCVL